MMPSSWLATQADRPEAFPYGGQPSLSEHRTCSTGDIILLNDAFVQGGMSSAAQSLALCRLAVCDVLWRDLSLSATQDSRVDCRPFDHCDGEPLRLCVAGAPLLPALLVYVRAHTFQDPPKSLRSHGCQYSGHHAIENALNPSARNLSINRAKNITQSLACQQRNTVDLFVRQPDPEAAYDRPLRDLFAEGAAS